MQCMFPLSVLCAISLGLAGCSKAVPPAHSGGNAVADSAEHVHPIGTGQTIPAVTLRGVDGQPVVLLKAVAKQPTVLIFYRGGWCPYCNVQLGQLGKLEPDLKALGYQILAVSPDRPEELAKSIQKHSLAYVLLSDSDMTAAKAFGLAFRVDEALVDQYKTKYGIDLEAAAGQKHHELPVPAAFIVDTSGRIRYEYVNSDYKVRVDPEKLLEEARLALKK